MLKKTVILLSFLSVIASGCSSDPRNRREAEGNENYLTSPELKPLIVPDNIDVPIESGDYYIFKAAREGEVGKNVDIRPPLLPLSTIDDSYVVYEDGMIKLDIPNYSQFWSNIPSILAQNNISLLQHDAQSIQTGERWVYRPDEAQAVEAKYLLQRKQSNGREYITVELTSLKRMGQDIVTSIESQYYVVEFFNMLTEQQAALTKTQ